MENKGNVSYFAYEAMANQMERTNHRLWIICLVLIFSLIASNLAWILYESQFETYEETTQEVTQSAESESGDAENRFIGGDYYGEIDSDSNNND